MKVLIFVMLCITFIAAEQTLKLQVQASSNRHYLALIPIDGVAPTQKVEIKEALLSSEEWIAMRTNTGGFWELNAPNSYTGFRFPLSLRLTSTNGNTVTIPSIISSMASLALPIIDLGVQYAGQVAPGRPNRPSMSTTAPIATSAPLHCSGSMKLMVPLYVYPGLDWDLVAANANLVKTVAIIRTSNLQTPPDNTYIEYMQKLYDAGVDLIGYVDTAYGARSVDEVKADIDIYATQYPLLSGIFLDKASASASKQPHYQTLYTYITSMPGWTYDVINPGMIPHSSYINAATQIVTFSDYGASLASSSVPTWAACEYKDKFVAIAHSVGVEGLVASVDTLLNKNYIGYVYVTEGAGDFSKLSTYYATLVANLLSLP